MNSIKNLKLFAFGFLTTFTIISVFTSSLLADNNTNGNSTLKGESRIESLAKYKQVLDIVENIYVDNLTFEEIVTKSIE
jgi:hypothetical protein